jgi:hypothetical protein
MVIGSVRDAELEEDAPDVAFDGAFGEDESLGDAVVGASLGHESEDLALAVTEFSEIAVGKRSCRTSVPERRRPATRAKLALRARGSGQRQLSR